MTILKKMRDCSGQAMVEFAIILPLVLLLIMGMIEFGRIYHAQLAVDNAARQAARVAAVGGDDAAVQQAAVDSTSSIAIVPTQVTVTPATRPQGTNITVNVPYTVNVITPIISNIIGNSIVVHSQVVMRRE